MCECSIQLTDDLRSVDSPASLRLSSTNTPAKKTAAAATAAAAPAASVAAGHIVPPVAPDDVNIAVIPPSPQLSDNLSSGRPEQDVGDIIVKEDASKQHVFAKVVLNTAGGQSETGSGEGPGESSTDGSFNDGANTQDHSEVRSLSLDSNTSTGSAKRHLWGDKSRSKMLKLKIPSQSSQEQDQEPAAGSLDKQDEVDRLEVGLPPGLHQSENGRLRTGSEISAGSKTSESELITKEEAPELRRPPPSAQSNQSAGDTERDSLDFKGAAGVLKLLKRKARQEENNNDGRTDDGSETPTAADSLARR